MELDELIRLRTLKDPKKELSCDLDECLNRLSKEAFASLYKAYDISRPGMSNTDYHRERKTKSAQLNYLHHEIQDEFIFRMIRAKWLDPKLFLDLCSGKKIKLSEDFRELLDYGFVFIQEDKDYPYVIPEELIYILEDLCGQ